MHYLVHECCTSLHASDNDLLSCLDRGHSQPKSLQASGQGFDQLLHLSVQPAPSQVQVHHYSPEVTCLEPQNSPELSHVFALGTFTAQR